MKINFWVFFVLFVQVIFSTISYAVPTREEVFRSDKLNTVVYKDGNDPNVFWFLPPVRLYENDEGKVVHYRREKEDHVVYYFYILPYMTDDLIRLLSGEIPNFQRLTQLKPIIAKRFGIKVPTFHIEVMGEMMTDYHYLNQPQILKIELPKEDSEEFDFLIQNKPGVQATVLFEFDSERIDKYVNFELKHKEVFDAMNIKLSGRYQFARAEIEKSLTNYISNKYMNVKSKGNLAIPEVVNRAIDECFTPIQRKRNPYRSGGGGYPFDIFQLTSEPNKSVNQDLQDYITQEEFDRLKALPTAKKQEVEKHVQWRYQLLDTLFAMKPNDQDQNKKFRELIKGVNNSGSDWFDPMPGGANNGTTNPAAGDNGDIFGPSPGGSSMGDPTDPIYPPEPTDPTNPSLPGVGRNRGPELAFMFKKELANSDKTFYYSHQSYADSSEIAGIPVFISFVPTVTPTKVKVYSLPKLDFIVGAEHSANSPYRTGIQIGENEQYIVQTVFSYEAESFYGDKGKKYWYRWDSSWPDVYEDLYYRIGDGPWNKVSGRVLIKSEEVYHGELQFYLDRNRIWEKIPEDFKKRGVKIFPFWPPPIFTYEKIFPQFNVVITGRRLVLGK